MTAVYTLAFEQQKEGTFACHINTARHLAVTDHREIIRFSNIAFSCQETAISADARISGAILWCRAQRDAVTSRTISSRDTHLPS